MHSRRTIAAATAAALALTLAACGGGGGDGSSNNGGGGGDDLTVAWPSVGSQLDPNVFEGLTAVYNMDPYMEGLLNYDTSKGGDRVLGIEDIEPALAESWEVNEDRTIYTLKLREGVMSEDGNELTADDVVWSFNRMLSAPTGLAAGVLFPSANVDPKEPMRKVDDYTVTFHLTEPSSVGLAVLAYPIIGIIDSDAAKEHATADDEWASEWLAKNSAGFGAYKVESLTPNESITYVSNENYWGDAPAINKVLIRAVPEGASRAQLVQSGDVSLANDIPIPQRQAIEDSDSAQIVESPDTNRHNISLNTRDPQLQDPRVRKALSMAINRDAIVEAVYQGYATPALTPLSSSLVPDQEQSVSYDPDGAKQLLADAGAEGLSLTLTINNERPGPFAEDMARLIQSDWNAIGVKSDIKVIPSGADFEAAVAEKSLQAYLYTERPAFADPGYALFLYLSSGSSLNNTGYTNKELDALIADILATEPGPDRDALLKQATDIVAEDAPTINLVEVPDVVATSGGLTGYVALPTGSTAFEDLSWE